MIVDFILPHKNVGIPGLSGLYRIKDFIYISKFKEPKDVSVLITSVALQKQ